MLARASAKDLAEVLDYMLISYVPVGKEIPPKLAKVWMETIKDAPYFSICHCAKHVVESNREWMPKPGQFLQAVISHSRSIDRLRLELENAQVAA